MIFITDNEEKIKSKGSPLMKRLKESTKKQTESLTPSTLGKNIRETPKKEKETSGQDIKTPQPQSSSRKRPKLKSHQTILGEIQRMINETSDKEEEQKQTQQQVLKEPIQLLALTPPVVQSSGEVTQYSEIKKKKFGSTFSLKHTSDEEEKKLKKERKREKKAQKEQKHLEKKRYIHSLFI